MAYASRADLELRFGFAEVAQLADPYGTGQADDDVLGPALADADAEIDAYLVGRYSLPLTAVPSNLVRIACDIARYRLWKHQASEEVRHRYADAVRYLERVASGQIGIGPDTSGETQPATGGGVAYGASPRRFPDAAFGDM